MIQIWTSGDDQAITFTCLNRLADHVISSQRFDGMAAAGITGIRFYPGSDDPIFVGADQRVSVFNRETKELSFSVVTDVGDVAGLSIHCNFALIVGIGVQVVKFF